MCGKSHRKGIRGSVRSRGQNTLLTGVKNKTKEHVTELWNWLMPNGWKLKVCRSFRRG